MSYDLVAFLRSEASLALEVVRQSKEARAIRGLLRIARDLEAEADLLEEALTDERDSNAVPPQTSSTEDNFHKSPRDQRVT